MAPRCLHNNSRELRVREQVVQEHSRVGLVVRPERAHQALAAALDLEEQRVPVRRVPVQPAQVGPEAFPGELLVQAARPPVEPLPVVRQVERAVPVAWAALEEQPAAQAERVVQPAVLVAVAVEDGNHG